jgi:putative transposase
MVLNPIEFLVTFLPRKRRCLTRTGVEIHCLQYWADALEPWVGQGLKVLVHYDPRDITRVHVRTPGGVLVMAEVTTPGVPAISLAEWEARRHLERSVSRHPDLIARADESQKRGDELISQAKASRRVRRRKATAAAGDHFRASTNISSDSQLKVIEIQNKPESDPDPVVLGTPLHIFEIEGYDHDD